MKTTGRYMDYKNVKTSEKMNESLKMMLKLNNDNYSLYALKYIEELEAKINFTRSCKSDSELLSCETCKFNCDDWDENHPCANCAGFEFWEAT
jgi:hypothetical protein